MNVNTSVPPPRYHHGRITALAVMYMCHLYHLYSLLYNRLEAREDPYSLLYNRSEAREEE